MNPKDQIHYDIAELLEKIAHLNIKLAGTTKIHPVEIDLLRTYIAELDKLTNAMPVMPLSKPSFSIPNSPQEEATTLPSFNTPLETEEIEAPAATDSEPVAEQTVDADINETEETDYKESKEHESDTEENEALAAEEPIIETVTPVTEPTEQEEMPETEATVQEEIPIAEATEQEKMSAEEDTTDAFAFEDLAAPVTDTPQPQEETPTEESVVINDTDSELETTEATIEPETTAEEVSTSFIDSPVTAEEPVAETEPEQPTEQPEEEPQANTGPELPIVETPLSYEPPVKEPEAKRSINDMFSREGKEDLGSKFQFQNRKNLREMIDLSERYVFTKELFGGDADYYDKAIRQLNQYETLEEAQAYMNNELHSKYKWTGKEQVQKQFARIVERRYA